MLEGYQYDGPAKGFQRAKKFLEEKYNDPLTIRTAALNRARRCSAILMGRNQLSALEHSVIALRALIYLTEFMMYNEYTDFI